MTQTLTIRGRIPSKKNGKRIVGRGSKKRLISSEEHEKWLVSTLWELKAQRPKKGIDRCSIKLLFYMPDNRTADLSNKTESVMDALVDAEIITDDSWQVVCPLTLDCAGIDKTNPRVVISIEEYAKV